MKVLYKTVMFLTLLIFCVGSVCATEPNNTTGDGGLSPVNPPINNTTDIVKNTTNILKMVNSELEKRDTVIHNQDLRIKALENSSADKDIRINELNATVNNQSVIINSLKDDNKVLTDRVQALEYSKLTQSNRIKSLEIDIKNLDESNNLLIDSNKQKDIDIKELKDSNKQLVDSNKVLNNTVNNQAVKINELNNTVNNQTVIINELNNKLELQLNEIKGLQTDKDKLNAEINKLKDEKCSIYEKLLESPKKEDFEQLKAEINNKDKQIEELNTQIDKLNNEIKTLKAINSISRNDVVNSLKVLSSTKNIQCGQYTFKLNDYLKIPLIKNGKNDIVKFKKDNGRLPKYVMIAGYKVPKNVYQKLYNL